MVVAAPEAVSVTPEVVPGIRVGVGMPDRVASGSVCGKLNSNISGEREFETENMRAIRVE